jgi:hypothetical protein
MAWAFVAVLSGIDPGPVSPTERRRLTEKQRHLRACPDPAAQLATWLKTRATRHELSAPPHALDDLRQDPRVTLSGISDSRAALSSAHELEGYVLTHQIEDLQADHLLIRSATPNVFLHGCDQPLAGPVPLGLVLADIAEHGGPREEARVHDLLEIA